MFGRGDKYSPFFMLLLHHCTRVLLVNKKIKDASIMFFLSV